MSFESLREYVQKLESRGLFRWIDAEIEKDWEISAVVRSLFRGLPPEKRFGVGFKNVKGYPDPVIVGILGASKYVQAVALETEPDPRLISKKLVDAQKNPIDPIIVNKGSCKDVIYKDEQADLYKFPAPVWTPGKDSNPYFTPLWVTKNPETGQRNVGMYRAELKGKNKLGIYYCNPSQDALANQKLWDKINKPMEAAVIIGADPSIYLAGVTKCPNNVDEFSIAGGIRRAPVKLVKCETIDIEVPAAAEIIVEGIFEPNVREAEGPFGEWTGYMAAAPYGMPVFRVKCITHRKTPWFQGVLSQMPPSESSGLRQTLFEGLLLKHLIEDLGIINVVDVHLPESSGCNGIMWISVKNAYRGLAHQIAYAAIGRIGITRVKWVIVVDEDINIRDSASREWALTFRVRPEEDINITTKTIALMMDPSSDEENAHDKRLAAKVIIDATKKSKYPQTAFPDKKYFEDIKNKWDQLGLPEVDFSWLNNMP